MRNAIPVPQEMPDFTLLSQPPIPDLLNPVFDDTVDNPIIISWSDVAHESGISGYELEINDQKSSHTDTSVDVELEDGEYLIQVRAINGLGNPGGWSKITRITVNKTLSVYDSPKNASDGVLLMQNYPNPVHIQTIIPFSIKEPEFVTLEVLNLDGRFVATLLSAYLKPGPYHVSFTSGGLPGGIYLYRLTTKNKIITRRMTLMR